MVMIYSCMNLVETADMYDSSDSDSSGELHSIFPIIREIPGYCEYKWGAD